MLTGNAAVRRYLGWIGCGTMHSVLATAPQLGDDPTPIGNACHPAFYPVSQPPDDRARRLDNDARSMSDGVLAG